MLLDVERALGSGACATRTAAAPPAGDETGFATLVGSSPAMRALFALIERVAPSPATVLIVGESGTGKELVARAIHLDRARDGAPFRRGQLRRDLPETLLESELFGHERGAFTGAATARARAVRGGATAARCSSTRSARCRSPLQAKLLRVLEERQVRPVGSDAARTVDVRVLCGDQPRSRDAVAEGRFREDLFYRLNVVPIRVPPLRERGDDVPLLVDHFLARAARAIRTTGARWTTAAVRSASPSRATCASSRT